MGHGGFSNKPWLITGGYSNPPKRCRKVTCSLSTYSGFIKKDVGKDPEKYPFVSFATTKVYLEGSIQTKN